MEDYLARYDRRAVHASRTYDGMVVIEAVLPVEEGEEVLGILAACGTVTFHRPDGSPLP